MEFLLGVKWIFNMNDKGRLLLRDSKVKLVLSLIFNYRNLILYKVNGNGCKKSQNKLLYLWI